MSTHSSPNKLDPAITQGFINDVWEDSIVPAISDYIRIPNKSPLFEPDWHKKGHMARAVQLIEGWCRENAPAGTQIEVIEAEGRTPLILMEVPGSGSDTVMLYGHLDKQPEMIGWRDGLDPWTPVREGDRLYGRGGADDGYSAFASVTALKALAEQGVPHSRAVVVIEACEESGSFDLPHYMEALKDRIGTPSLVVCLDSGCGDYDRLWATTSLRGFIMGELRVEILREGVHSGDASGIVPDSFRIVRQLLSRLEDETTGQISLADLNVEIPTQRLDQAAAAAAILGEAYVRKFPFQEGAGPVEGGPTDYLLNRSWRPALTITGADGLPALGDAGNVLRPQTTVKVSLRTPPTLDSDKGAQVLRRLFEADPPYGARVTFQTEAANGWDAPALAPWLERSLADASSSYFKTPAAFMGEGGSIPFMAMLGERFPAAQFLITGLLGPESNAHGPNEFLHIECGKRLTACVAQVLADQLNNAQA